MRPAAKFDTNPCAAGGGIIGKVSVCGFDRTPKHRLVAITYISTEGIMIVEMS